MSEENKQDLAMKGIKSWIEDGRYVAGDKLPPILEIAALLKMKSQPVRKAIEKLVKQGVLRTVNGVGVYVKSPDDKNERNIMIITANPSGHSMKVDEIQAGFEWEIYNGISKAAEESGIGLTICMADDFSGKPSALLDKFEENKCLGIICLFQIPPKLEDFLVDKIGRAKVVSAGYNYKSCFRGVKLNIEAGVSAALEKAWELGHRKYAFIYGNTLDTSWSHLERYRVFTKFCLKHNIAVDPRCMIPTDGHTPIDAYRETLRVLDNFKDVTMIFVVTDLRAEGVLKVIEDKGLTLGKDVSVISYDDIPQAATMKLTSVKVPREEIGRKSVELLFNMASAKGEPPEYVIDTFPVFRESLGPALSRRETK